MQSYRKPTRGIQRSSYGTQIQFLTVKKCRSILQKKEIITNSNLYKIRFKIE